MAARGCVDARPRDVHMMQEMHMMQEVQMMQEVHMMQDGHVMLRDPPKITRLPMPAKLQPIMPPRSRFQAPIFLPRL